MEIEAYCDEAYPDLFSSSAPQAKYLVIGSLWLKSEKGILIMPFLKRLTTRMIPFQ